MSFSDHKITAFQHKITDLPDQPTLAPNELKARFDSSPEELRQAVNGICDDASRLEARVEGIVVDTFGDTIDREMLSDELAAELDAKANETSVAARFAAEQAARQTSDSALDARLTEVAAQKCEIYLGTYTGSGINQIKTITLGFKPKAVLVACRALQGDYYHPQLVNLVLPTASSFGATITDTGFTVTDYLNCTAKEASDHNPYRYIAFK